MANFSENKNRFLIWKKYTDLWYFEEKKIFWLKMVKNWQKNTIFEIFITHFQEKIFQNGFFYLIDNGPKRNKNGIWGL